MSENRTKSEATISDVAALLKARCTLLWVVTREEVRAERGLIEAAARARYETRLWDCAAGLQDPEGGEPDGSLANPTAMLRRIGEDTDRRVYILRDLHRWLDPIVLRSLRSLARDLQTEQRETARAVVVLTPSSEIPPELAGHAVVIDYPMPDRAEIASILDDVLSALPDNGVEPVPNGARDAAIDAAVGLTAEEAGNCYARSLVTTRRIDPRVVSAEKKRVIARERVLTWHDPDPRGLAAVGGLELLKAWLTQRRLAFSQKARDFGLPAPKGVLLVGVPGCGKSLVAKSIATAWEMPLLRLDVGALRSKYVGDSEANIRKALSVAEAVAPCVLWLDEIEKALGGATGPQGDGGVSADALGAILSWMQDREGSVFVVATANDVSALPPELLRKGRFDEMFFVDLPNITERRAILAATLAQYGRDGDALGADVSPVVNVTDGWSGAEIASLVPDALFTAFADGERPLGITDLVNAAEGVTPLSQTARERIDGLRKWSKGRTRPASISETEAGPRKRALDLA